MLFDDAVFFFHFLDDNDDVSDNDDMNHVVANFVLKRETIPKTIGTAANFF